MYIEHPKGFKMGFNTFKEDTAYEIPVSEAKYKELSSKYEMPGRHLLSYSELGAIEQNMRTMPMKNTILMKEIQANLQQEDKDTFMYNQKQLRINYLRNPTELFIKINIMLASSGKNYLPSPGEEPGTYMFGMDWLLLVAIEFDPLNLVGALHSSLKPANQDNLGSMLRKLSINSQKKLKHDFSYDISDHKHQNDLQSLGIRWIDVNQSKFIVNSYRLSRDTISVHQSSFGEKFKAKLFSIVKEHMRTSIFATEDGMVSDSMLRELAIDMEDHIFIATCVSPTDIFISNEYWSKLLKKTSLIQGRAMDKERKLITVKLIGQGHVTVEFMDRGRIKPQLIQEYASEAQKMLAKSPHLDLFSGFARMLLDSFFCSEKTMLGKREYDLELYPSSHTNKLSILKTMSEIEPEDE